MKTIDMGSGFSSRRDTKELVDARVDYIMGLLLKSKDMVEIYHAAAEGIDLKQVHGNYTQRLLELQERLNAVKPGLGYDVATKINDRIETMDYFTALGVIDYIAKNRTRLPAEEIVGIPEIIAGIKGKNGSDSKVLKHHFVSRWLSRATPQINLARLARKFVDRYVNKDNSQESEDIEHTRQKCIEWYGGDFEKMKKLITDKVRADLEGVVRKLTQIEKAEPADKTSNSSE